MAVHLVVLPLPHVLPPVRPLVRAVSFDLVIQEVAAIDGAIGPLELPLAVLEPPGVVALVLGAVLAGDG